MRSDPSDNGGLFVGRRPGTAPTRFRALPQRGSQSRQRVDNSLANLLLAAMTVGSILCWGPIPLACIWISAQSNYLTGSVSLGFLIAIVALFVMLFSALVILRKLDNAWVLVRRAAGHDQRTGVLPQDIRHHRGSVRSGVLVLVRGDPRTWLELDAREQAVKATRQYPHVTIEPAQHATVWASKRD